MLITSWGAKGKCPVCGAANCQCGGPTTIIPVDERITEASVGKLVTIQTGRPGVGVKMTVEEARRQGLLPKPAEEKAEKPVRNKMRRPESTK